MKMVYDERFGDMSFAQRAAYRKHNVSQSDHWDLIDIFGEDDHAGITACVKRNAEQNGGLFSAWNLRHN